MTSNFGNWQSYGKTPSNPTNKDLKPIKPKEEPIEGSFSSILNNNKSNIDTFDSSIFKSVFDSMKNKESSNSNSTQIKGEGTIGSYVNPLFDKLTETDMAELEDFSNLKSGMMSGMFLKDETIIVTEKND